MCASDPKTCPQCGKPLPADAPSGLCPSCVMAMNLSPETRMSTADSAAAGKTPLSPEEMAERFPNFAITEYLGRGGMGIVYKAQQKTLDRVVAIKVLAGEWQDDPQFAERFEREAKTLAQMSHPSIVTVHDFGEADGLYYIVMEYVDGVNLRDLLTDGNMAPEQALAIVPPICEALEYAHGKGVVHRDIKPENLLLDRDGRVKIADFGIASLVGTKTEISGTPSYMAPEQLAGSVDRRADIYALGVVLYEMLTGERPDENVVAPSKKVEVDVKIDEMVLRALEKEPERRYQTAHEFQSTAEMLATYATKGDGGIDAGFQRTESSPERTGALLDSSRGFKPSYGIAGFATAATFFYVGVILSMLLIDLTGFNRGSAYLLTVGLMLVAAPFVGVAASNALRRSYASGDPERRRSAAAWLKAGSLVAGLLALPAIGFAVIFLRALANEQGGWHPAVSESVLVPLTWLGAVLLPVCSICLWWVGRDSAADSKSSNARPAEKSPWPRRVFWVLASLVVTAPLVFLAMIFALQAARLGVGEMEAILWLAGAGALVILALVPPVMVLVSLRRHPADARNPWLRRIAILLLVVPALLFGILVFVLVPVWMATSSDDPVSPDDKLTVPETGVSFNADREVVLLEVDTPGKGPRFLDLDSGRTTQQTPKVEEKTNAQTFQWMSDEGLDLCATKVGQEWGLATLKLRLVRISPEQLPDISVDEVRRILKINEPGLKVDDDESEGRGTGYFLPDPLPAGLALAFRTSEGAVGVMHIDELPKRPARLRIRYKLVSQKNQTSHDSTEPPPAEPHHGAFQGRWLWEEVSEDKVWLIIPKAGPASMQGTDLGGRLQFHSQFDWTVSDGKLAIALGQEKATGELTGGGESLRMETTKDERSILFQKTENAPPALETDLVIIEDLALHMIVAIREKDDEKLKSLATDRIKDWPDALPVFAVELRERYRQLIGDEEFDLRVTESMVKDDLGIVRCAGPELLEGKCLVLSFVKTPAGWKNSLLRNSTEDVELREHLRELERQLDVAKSRKDEE